jgi:prepilin-type N-terminal cleavage/methylation domain-containing protein
MKVANRKLDFGIGCYCGLRHPEGTRDCGLRLFNPKSEIRIPKSVPRAGMTLIELLVVIVILTTVVAAAIPIMAPSNVDRQLREATRTLNTFITGAQARAIASGRPYGIALKRLSQETDTDGNPFNPNDDRGACLEVFYVEQPPAYTGYDRNSRVCLTLLRNVGLVSIRFMTQGTQVDMSQDQLPVGWDADLFPTGMVRPGDVIEIGDSRFELIDHTKSRGNQEPVIQFARVDIDQTGYFRQRPGTVVQIIARPINDTGQQVYPKFDDDGFQLGEDRPPNLQPPQSPYWTRPAPYKILRQATFTSDEPYQLPEGTAIDLRASGVGNRFFYYPAVPSFTAGSHPRVDNDAPIFIMFAPEGRVSRVTFNWSTLPSAGAPQNEKFDQAVAENVFLLVGRRENIPPPPTSGANPDRSLDPNNWVSASTEQRAALREPINWLLGESRWLVIGAQSGRIVTIENGFGEPSPAIFGLPLGEDRRNQQIIAAREFAPEMSQLGGR